MSADAEFDAGWRVGSKRLDWLRSLRCALTGIQWDVNQSATQRACPRCWIVQDRRVTPPDEADQ